MIVSDADFKDWVDAVSKVVDAVGVAIVVVGLLEFLVAGDIIRTVAVDPSFQSAGVLALIVLIRTFLSMALQVEIDGRWPWQPRKSDPPPAPGSPTR